MKRYIILALLSIFTLSVSAEEYAGICSLISQDDRNATFESAGLSAKSRLVEENAIHSLFHALFYVGIEGVNNGQPLVQKENKTYTNGFFNEQAKYSFYIISKEPIEKVLKVGNEYRATYRVQIRLSKLIADLKMNKVYVDTSNPMTMSASDVQTTSNMVLPTIIVVPFKTPEYNSFAEILQNDYDRRVAVSAVQKGFEEKNITTIDLLNKINAAQRMSQYDKNSGAGQSSDRALLQQSGADISVEVDVMKDVQQSGSRVSLTLKASETASGNIIATQVATTNRRYQTVATDVLCAYAVQDNIDSFLEQILKNFAPSKGTRVSLSVSIDGSATRTMNDPAGSKGYALSNVIRQWVRKNAHEGKFHLQGMVDDNMTFDYIVIPPIDVDGLRMDAAQFSFLLEEYLKETENIPCSARLEGNKIMITIYD